jgi:hypothetical protein
MQLDFFNRAPENKKEQTNPVIERAYPQAIKTLKENAISIDEFDGFYDEKKLALHRSMVAKKEARFSHEAHKEYSDVLEAVIFDQCGNGKWFGEQTHAIKTSTFDDYINGSDLILEIEDTARALTHLSLSVDVTFGTTTEADKFAKIKENIDSGDLGKINYFRSSRSTLKGEISHVPQVVMGVEKDTVVKLANLWMDKNEHPELATTLDEHPIRRLLLSEILLQLYTFKNYADKTKRPHLVPIYEKDIQILEDIIRKQGPIDIGELRGDKVFLAIKESLSAFK